MVERYLSTIGYFRSPGKTAEPQSYPIGDFLGPDLVIWTIDPNAQMPTTSLRAPAQSGVVTALLIGTSTFSTRIGVVPLSNEELAACRKVDAQSPGQAQQDVFLGGCDGGHITLAVDEPLGSAAYNALRQQTAAHPNVWLNGMAKPVYGRSSRVAGAGAAPNGLRPPPEPYSVLFLATREAFESAIPALRREPDSRSRRVDRAFMTPPARSEVPPVPPPCAWRRRPCVRWGAPRR